MSHRPPATGLLLLLAATAFAGTVHAQSQPAGPAQAQVSATAEALYEAGRELMKAKKYAEACSKLQESLRIDPAVGTMLYLADCYEKNGQTASAWSMFSDAAAAAQQANQGDRALKAKLRVEKLAPKLVRLSITLSPDNTGIESLEIKRGGLVVGTALLGTPVPVDPGDHTIEVTAAGKKPWSGVATVPAKPGSSISFVIPKLEDLPVLPPEPPPTPTVTATASAPPPPPTVTATAPPPPPPPPPPDYTMRNVGLVVGGVGVAGIAVASALGLMAKAKNDDSIAGGCDSQFCPNQDALDLSNEAKVFSIGSTVAFIVSGAVVATGAGLIIYGTTSQPGSPPTSGRVTSQVVVGPGSLSVRGQF